MLKGIVGVVSSEGRPCRTGAEEAEERKVEDRRPRLFSRVTEGKAGRVYCCSFSILKLGSDNKLGLCVCE